MKFNLNYFCGLSSSPTFLTWLNNYSSQLCHDLKEHLRSGKGCTANSNKMIQVFNKIMESPDGKIELYEFIRKRFPFILNAKKSKTPVFDYYDPALLTMPYRHIIENVNNLDKEVKDFINKQAISDYVIVDNVAYIEYLPPELANYAVPIQNWQVKKYKEKINVKP